MYIRRMNPKINKAIFSGACSVALFISAIYLSNITYLLDQSGALKNMFTHTPKVLYFLPLLSFPVFWHIQAGPFRRQYLGPLLTGFFFATFMVFGVAIDQLHDLRPLFSGAARATLLLFTWLSLTWIFYLLCLTSYRLISKKLAEKPTEHTRRHIPAWVIILVLIIGWLPYLVIFFPGTICVDNLDMYAWAHNLPDGYFCSHQCVVPTLILGFLPDFYNTLFGSFTLGTFFLVVTSTVLLLFAVLYAIHTMEKLGAPFWLQVLTLLWFAFCPIFGFFSQWIGKDTISLSLGLFFFSLFALALKDIQKFCKKPHLLIGLCVTGVLLGLFRHERILLIFLCFVILIIFALKNKIKKTTILILILPIICTPVIDKSLEYVTHADSDSSKDTLGMLYNLTARYARDSHETIPDNEREDIEQVLGDYDRLASDYLAYSADPVKNPEKKDADHGRYLKTWFAQGLRHPLIYLSGIAEQSYGFWALAPQNDFDQDWVFSTSVFTGIKEGQPYPGQYRENKEPQQAFLNFLDTLRNAPLIGLLNKSGFYVWALFFVAGYAFYTKDKKCLCFLLPFFFMWLVCLASPLAASIRYAIGIIGGTPLFLTVGFWGREIVVTKSAKEVSKS